MGLLDALGTNDPQSMATWQLVGGLLSPGSFGQGLSRGMQGYQGSLAANQDMQLKKAQITEAQQAAAMQGIQIQRAQAQLAEAQRWGQPNPQTQAQSQVPAQLPPSVMAGAPGTTPGAAVTGNAASPMNPAMAAPQGAPQGSPSLPPGVAGYVGMPLEQLRARMNAGLEPKEALQLWQAANIGTAVNAGQYRIIPGQAPQYMLDPKNPFTVSPTGQVGIAPGGTESLSAVAAATAGGTEQAQNANRPLTPDQLASFPGLAPGSTIADLLASRPKPLAPANDVPGGSLAQQSPRTQSAVLASMSKYGMGTVNGQPIGAPAPASSGVTFNTPADLAGQKITAENVAKLATQPQLDSATSRATNIQASDKTYGDELNKRVEEGFNLTRRNAEIAQQMQDYATGVGGADTRVHLASNLQNMFPGNATMKALAEKINGGSVVSAQTLNSLVAGAMVTNAIQVLDGQGRLTKAITSQLQQAAESAATDPGALTRIMAIQNKFAAQDFAEQQARASAIKAKTYNPETWQADYSAQKFGGMTQPGSVYSPATSTTSGFKYLGKQ